MNEKKTILHIINYLGRGGAEVMLVKVLQELKEYNNIVVTLNPENHFGEEFKCDAYYCLNMGSFTKFPIAAQKLKKFIKKNKIDIVHSHLFSATLVARIATPKKIPLITTIHTNVTASNEYKKWYLKLLDSMSYKMHKSTIVGVSSLVLKEYFAFLNHKLYKKYLLYTFGDIQENENLPVTQNTSDKNVFRLVTIGALRYPKNQQYLVKAFEKLKDENFELHIYGEGKLQHQLQAEIDRSGAKVVLKGEVKNASKLIPQYNLYVMSSEFEGFSISVLEAMAMQMPLLLSDIPSFREQCDTSAIYFDLNNVEDFVSKLKQLAKDDNLRTTIAAASKQRVMNNFTLQHHMDGLRKIYTETLNIT